MQLKASATSKPPTNLNGTVRCTVDAEGLLVRQGKRVYRVCVGSPTEYLGNSSLRVQVESTPVELNITTWASYENRLAKDLACYLAGTGPALDPRGYALPWLLRVPVILPLGIPIITVGGVLPSILSSLT